MDAHLTELLRAAESGDPAARERWELAALRAGLPVIRTAGVYRCEIASEADPGGWISWLRFYPQEVLVVSTVLSATPADLARWFHPGSDSVASGGIGRGAWTLGADRLAFESVSPNGMVAYAGSVHGLALELESHSHITGWRGRHTWEWVALPDG